MTAAANAPTPTAAGPADHGTDDDILALEHFLPYRLSVLSNTVSRAIAREYDQRFGLSISQWRIMAILGRFPGLSANEVVERTAMDKVMVSRAVAGLVKDGRLLRQADPDDRRRSVMRLSDAGRAVYDQIVPLARQYETRLQDALTPAERTALEAILDKLTAASCHLTT